MRLSVCDYCDEFDEDCECWICPSCDEVTIKENVCVCGQCNDCCICGEKEPRKLTLEDIKHTIVFESEQEYNVLRPEVHHTLLKVKAKSPEEALELAKAGEELEITDLFEFSHIPDTGWKVEDKEGNLLLDE